MNPPGPLGPSQLWYLVPADVDDGALPRLAQLAGEPSEPGPMPAWSWRQRVLSRALVRAALSARVPVSAGDWSFERDASGRPHVTGPVGGVGFSLSHTGGLLVCATAATELVGVDTERLDRSIEVDGVASLCCSEAERRWLDGLPSPQRAGGLLELWTLKEAYLKALGKGLLPASARAASFRIEEGRAPEFHSQSADTVDWRFRTFIVRASHLVSFALADAAGAELPEPVSAAELVGALV
jgi:4'-phosphopantetheinyl transferase